jgi:hypothetical protein
MLKMDALGKIKLMQQEEEKRRAREVLRKQNEDMSLGDYKEKL